MIRVVVNGIEIRKCGWCEEWTDQLICPCHNRRLNPELERLMNTFRKRNKVFLFTTPFHSKENNHE